MPVRRRIKLNSEQRKKLYARLVKIRGKRCWVCGNTKRRLIVDCVFNDDDYKTPGKQQLLCSPCNSKKNPRGKIKILQESTLFTLDAEPKLISSTEFQTNRDAEPEFISWLFRMVSEHGEIPVRDAKNAGAMFVSRSKVSISQQTIARYIDKQVSREGIFVIEEKDEGEAVIRFRKRDPAPPPTVDAHQIAQSLAKDSST